MSGLLPAVQVLCGRYRLDRLLGIGGMSQVWRARDLLHEQYGDPQPDIALKLLSEAFDQVPDAGSLLYGEFALTRHLHHPGVVRCYSFEVDTQRPCAFITLELMHGLTLDHVLCECPTGMPAGELPGVALPLLQALAHCHARGVLHGDLKPGNVMLGEHGLRLFDFGLGQAQPGVLPGLPQLRRDHYKAWTPAYAAPELHDGAPLSEASDLYAVACLIHELACGSHPFGRLPGDQARAARLDRSLHRPAKIPRRAWSALRQALSFDPAARPGAVQLHEALHGRADAGHSRIAGGPSGSTANTPVWFPGNGHADVLHGFKTQDLAQGRIGTGGYRQLQLDHTPEQSRAQLFTTDQRSGLTLGHIKQCEDNRRLKDRGL
ncbi:protein kinase, partial [Pseudomonas syringae]|nr:protein kinase [Pseudomonas syringae]